MGQKNESDYSSGDPYKNLWAAVVTNALKDLDRKVNIGPKGKRIHTQIHRRDAIHFFRSRYSSLPWICKAIGIPIEYVKRRAEDEIKRTGGIF